MKSKKTLPKSLKSTTHEQVRECAGSCILVARFGIHPTPLRPRFRGLGLRVEGIELARDATGNMLYKDGTKHLL